MNRLFILAALIFLLFIIGFAAIRPAVVVLILPLLLYLLLGLIYSPGEVKIRVERSLSAERLKTGDEVSVNLDVTNLDSTLEELLSKGLFNDSCAESIFILFIMFRFNSLLLLSEDILLSDRILPFESLCPELFPEKLLLINEFF